MKKSLWLLVIALILAATLVACGGSDAPTGSAPVEAAAEVVEDVAESPAEVVVVEEAVEEAAADMPEEPPATEEPMEEVAAEADAASAEVDATDGMQMSGVDPDTGLEINPVQIAPGIDYIIRGRLISFNLTPQDSPEFLIETPDGARFRIKSQPAPDIYFDDGTQLLPHEYRRGILAQATAQLEESARATSVMLSPNFTLLVEAP